jgi:ABC-type sugar transport system substrate-binding protein
MDDFQAMREVMVHLIEAHGYQQIAFMPGSEHHFGFRERYRAYVETLAEYDLPFNENLVLPSFDSLEFAYLAPRIIPILSGWLQERGAANWEALAAFSDTGALQILQALQPLGLQAPGDIAITGFDAGAESEIVTPPLTTVRPPFQEMGGKAVEMLLDLIAGETVPEQVVLPSELVVRQSCGCLLPAVAHVTANITQAKDETLKEALADRQEEILGAMKEEVGGSGKTIADDWAERLLKSLAAELNNQSPGIFLQELDNMLRQE